MIDHWIVKVLLFSIPFSWLIILSLYRSCKSKDRIIEHQHRIMTNMLEQAKQEYKQNA